MRTAQELYENGLISYMRTDSTTLSNDAIQAIDRDVTKRYGKHMVVHRQLKKAKKDRFAQEAHEAIRPAIQADGTFFHPDQITNMSPTAQRLYRMIYQRMAASHMPPLVTNQTSVVIEGTDGETTVHFRTSGSVVISPGYTLEYEHRQPVSKSSSSDDNDDESDEPSQQQLPPLEEGQILQLEELMAVDHQTQPPPRYTEASFVKDLEALGVGRPSTYAHIVQILRDRAYVGSPVTKDSAPRRRVTKSGPAISAFRAAGGEEFAGGSARGPLVPSLSAFVVCSLLEKHCPTYVDPGFTAKMEDRLDMIASGKDDESSTDQRVEYLNEFYAGDTGLAAQIKHIEDNVPSEEARRATLPTMASSRGDTDEEVGLFVGPWGPYVQQLQDGSDEKPPTAPLPASMAADLSTITPSVLKALLTSKQGGGVILGTHPEDGRHIRLKTGRFGAYLQWGDDGEEGTTTYSLPRQKAIVRDVESFIGDEDGGTCLSSLLGLTLEEAIGYVNLPRTVSTLNDLPIVASIGPYGPYLKYNNTFLSLRTDDGDVLTIDAETAEKLVTDGIVNGIQKRGRGVIAELGEKDGKMITVKSGRYGAYINWKNVNAKLPAEYKDDPSQMPLEKAWAAIQEKAGSGSTSGRGRNANSKSHLPAPPKRPWSAYLHFCAAKRPEVAESVKSLGEVSKRLAALWAEASEDDRRTYEAMAASSKEQYEEEKRAWEEECQKITSGVVNGRNGGTVRTSSGKRSRVKNGTAVPPPKRPRSAYLFFCSDWRPQVSKRIDSLGNISKELARLWSETTDRTKYEELAAADRQRYEKETKSYRMREGAVNGQPKPSGAGKRMTKSQSSKAPSRTPRAPSAYMLFCREYRPTVVGLPLGQTTKRLATMWKECDAETRAHFEQLASNEKKKVLELVKG
jgi:topoisomerase IA-like protein